MAIRTYDILLDSHNAMMPEPITGRAGDKTGAVAINATLTDNGAPVSMVGKVPMFMANSADGKHVIADTDNFKVTDAQNGQFTYNVPNNLWNFRGGSKITTAYFNLVDDNGTEATFNLRFVILKNVDLSQPVADDYVTIVDGTLRSLQAKIDDLGTSIGTVVDAYNKGRFYSKTDSDNRFVKQVDTDNWQKLKVVEDNGNFTGSVSNTEDVNVALSSAAAGLSTWYLQVGATNNPTDDSLRGYVMKDLTGYGNGLFISNAGNIFSVLFIGNKVTSWTQLAALNNRGVANGFDSYVNNNSDSTDLNGYTKSGIYPGRGGSSYWKNAPAVLSNGVQFWGFLEIKYLSNVIFQTLNWDDGHTWRSCRRSYAGSPGQWGEWRELNQTVLPY